MRPLARGAVLQERAAGGRCQGRAVPLPGASAPGAPGAAAGTWLRRHPPPPSGCVRACPVPGAARGTESRTQREIPRHADPFSATSTRQRGQRRGRRTRGTHRAGHAWGAGSAGALAPVPRPHPAALVHEDVDATAGAQRSGGRAADILCLAATAVCLRLLPSLAPHRARGSPGLRAPPGPAGWTSARRACAPPADLTPRQRHNSVRREAGPGGAGSQWCAAALPRVAPPDPAPPCWPLK